MHANQKREWILGLVQGVVGLVAACLMAVGLAEFFQQNIGQHPQPAEWFFGGLALRWMSHVVNIALVARWQSATEAEVSHRLDELALGPSPHSLTDLERGGEHVVEGVGISAAQSAAYASMAGIVLLAVTGGWLSTLIYLGLQALSVPMYIRAGRRSAAFSIEYDERRRALREQQLRVLESLPELRGVGAVDYVADGIGAVTDAEHRVVRRAVQATIGSSLVTDFVGGVTIGLVAMVVGFALMQSRLGLDRGMVALFVTIEMVTRFRAYASEFHRRDDLARGQALLNDHALVARVVAASAVWELDAVTAPGVSTPTNWRILPGERWVLRGPSGAGKSSLIDVALGLRVPDTGTVMVPSQRVGVVRASSHFLTGTVRDNLALGENFGDEEMITLLNHVSGLPVGRAFLDQKLHDLGSQLSDGERVRVALARALLHRAEVLVLDDVAALLDESSRHALSTYLRQRSDLTIVEAGHLFIVQQPTHELSLAAVS